MATPITSVSGIGAQTAEILVDNGFVDAESLAAAKEEDLLKISGFGPSKAKKFIAAAQALVGATEESSVQDEPVQAQAEVKKEVEPKAEKEEKFEKPAGPKVVTQKLCKKKKKKDKPGKAKKKKKKSSRKKKLK